MEKRKFIRKVCLLGDGGVGKTSLIRRYVFDSFSDDYIVTFGRVLRASLILASGYSKSANLPEWNSS